MADEKTTPTGLLRDILTEGVASQMRRSDSPPKQVLTWWHLITEDERNRWRLKAIKHLEQVGWE